MAKAKNYLISFAVGYVSIFLFFLITSVIFAYTNIEDKYLNIAIYISLGISTLVSAFILGKKTKEKGAINGIIYGVLFYFIIFLIGVILSGFNFSIDKLVYFIISILSGLIGAILGVNL